MRTSRSGAASRHTLGTRAGPLRSGLLQHLDTLVAEAPILPPMDNLPLHHTKWNDRLAFDIALTLEGSGETINEIVNRHRIQPAELLRFNQDPVFLRKVDHYRGEIREKGLTFRLKARAQAEELLTTSWLLIHDAAVSPAVKADLIKSTIKWAGLEPKDNISTDSGGGGVKITINLGPNPQDSRTIDVTPTPTQMLEDDDDTYRADLAHSYDVAERVS